MVGTEDLIPDDAVSKFGEKSVRHQNVVQSPTDVLGSAVHHVGPKCVGILLVGIEMPAEEEEG